MKSRIHLIIVLSLLLYQNQAIASLRMIYDRADALEVSEESKVKDIIVHILPSNNSFFQGEFEVVQDLISSKLKVTILVIRCQVGEAPDTCEYLTRLKPPNICMLINAENTAWNAITDSITPRLKCPIKKGRYVADRMTFDASKWNMFPLDNWYFKITFKMYEGDILQLAIITHGHFIRVH